MNAPTDVVNVSEAKREFVINCFIQLLGIFYPGVPEAYLRINAALCESSMNQDISLIERNAIGVELIFNLSKITDNIDNFNKIRMSLKEFSAIVLRVILEDKPENLNPSYVLEEYNKSLG